jgi:hypothetical protein
MVDRLLRRGIVSREFVAAVMLVDLETPIFSPIRAGLLRFVPETFTFALPTAPGAPFAVHPDELTKVVVAALESSRPIKGSPEDLFLAALRDKSPLLRLEERVKQYQARIGSALKDPKTKAIELDRLFDLLVQRRILFLRHETLGALDETGDRLLPVPSDTQRKLIHGSGGSGS